MGKAILLALTAATFVYALWLTLLNCVPAKPACGGVRNRFYLATLLFMGFLGAAGCDDLTCSVNYERRVEPRKRIVRDQPDELALASALSAVWLTLDPARSAEFGAMLNRAVSEGRLRRDVADMLGLAYREIGRHKQMASMHRYKPGAGADAKRIALDEALNQIDLLRRMHTVGAIDAELADRVRAALARDIAVLAKDAHAAPRGDAMAEAARLIVDIESAAPRLAPPPPRHEPRPGDVPTPPGLHHPHSGS